MNGEKTIINTIFGSYSVYAGKVYRGANANGAQVGIRLMGAIDEIPYSGLVAKTDGEFLVEDNSTAAQIRNALQPLATNYYAVVENDNKLIILPRTIQVEKRKTKSVRVQGISIHSQNVDDIT